MKTTLTVDFEYDPQKTDPDSLASAMDRLMETALSTPGIMAEYGNPVVGKFYSVADTEKQHAPGPAWRPYWLTLDGPLFREQRRLLMDLARASRGSEKRSKLVDGLVSLTDAIADQAHDKHGIDCLLVPAADRGPDQNVCGFQPPRR